MRLIERLRDASPAARWTSIIATLVVTGLIIWVLWAVVYRLFFQGQDLAKARGNAIVATEQGTAEANIAGRTMDAVGERSRGRDEIHIVVQEGRSRIDESWKGETVGADVDRAGAAALCGVHDSLCRLPAAPKVQPVR